MIIETIDGKRFEIEVNSRGEFVAVFDQHKITDETLKGLKAKLTKAVRQKKAAIPVTLIRQGWRHESFELEDGILTGIHAANRNALIRVGKTTEQISSSSELLRRLTDQEKVDLLALHAAKEAAEAAYETAVRSYAISAEQAMADATGEPEEE